MCPMHARWCLQGSNSVLNIHFMLISQPQKWGPQNPMVHPSCSISLKKPYVECKSPFSQTKTVIDLTISSRPGSAVGPKAHGPETTETTAQAMSHLEAQLSTAMDTFESETKNVAIIFSSFQHIPNKIFTRLPSLRKNSQHTQGRKDEEVSDPKMAGTFGTAIRAFSEKPIQSQSSGSF